MGFEANIYPQRRLRALQEQFWFARVIHSRYCCIAVYMCLCMCTMYKCTTCSFSRQLCNSPLCHLSQSSMLYCILYLLNFAFTRAVYAFSCSSSLQLMTHLSASQIVGFTLDYHGLRNLCLFIWDNLITSCSLELGHLHHKIYTDFI